MATPISSPTASTMDQTIFNNGFELPSPAHSSSPSITSSTASTSDGGQDQIDVHPDPISPPTSPTPAQGSGMSKSLPNPPSRPSSRPPTRPGLQRSESSRNSRPALQRNQSSSTFRPTLQRNHSSQSASSFRLIGRTVSGVLVPSALASKFSSGQTTPTKNSTWVTASDRNDSGTGTASPRSLFTTSRKNSFLFGVGGSRTPSVPQSPQLQAMLKKKGQVPDVNSVDKALRELELEPEPEGKTVNTDKLSALRAQLKATQADSKTQIEQAMRTRDEGKYEVSRALCLQIVQNQHSDASSMVFAYNILSQMTAPNHALDYLKRSAKLIEQHKTERPELEKLVGIVKMLKNDALERKAGRKASVSE